MEPRSSQPPPSADGGTCVFCALLEGRGTAAWIHRGDRASALLPLPDSSLAPGHCLVIPQAHVVGMQDAPADVLQAVTSCAQDLARGMQTALGAHGVNVLHASGAAAGQSVGHLHLHVVPRWEGDGLETWPEGRSAHVAPAEWLPALRAEVAR